MTSTRRQQQSRRPAGSPPPDVDRDSVLAFMQLLWAVDHGMRSVSTSMRARLGVTGPERLILRMVGRSPGVTAGDVARLLHRHASSLTAALQRLVDRGLLVSRTDPEDRRRVILHLTVAGQRIDGLSSGTVESAMRRALSNMRREEIRTAARVLEGIAQELLPDAQRKQPRE